MPSTLTYSPARCRNVLLPLAYRTHAGFVLGCPLTVGGSDLLPGDQHPHLVFEVRHLVRILHGIVDRFVGGASVTGCRVIRRACL